MLLVPFLAAVPLGWTMDSSGALVFVPWRGQTILRLTECQYPLQTETCRVNTASPCMTPAAGPAVLFCRLSPRDKQKLCSGLWDHLITYRALPWGFTCSTWRMSWLEAVDRGTSCTPWHRGPPFLVASGALRRISQDSASVAAELLSMRPMDCRAGGVTRQKRSESCSGQSPFQ